MMNNKDKDLVKKLRIGVIANTHGIKGEAKVFPTTDEPKRFSKIKKVYLVKNGTETESKIVTARYFKNLVICKFEGIDTPEAMRLYKTADIFVDRKDATPLKEGEHYIADLIGLNVLTEEGEPLGIVENIFPTGANQVMEVKRLDRKNLLIPYIKQFIIEVDLEMRTIKVRLIDGLLDL